MKVRNLLSFVEEALRDGDFTSGDPVFAVVRNMSAAEDSPEAWHAVSIVGLELDPDARAVRLVVDESDDAVDINVATLRTLAASLPAADLEYLLVAAMPAEEPEDEDDRDDVDVVDAYGDDQGLGLMIWFEGYEAWRPEEGRS
jgi:hypothetical protein